MEALLRFLDGLDGAVYAFRLWWPGRTGLRLRLILLVVVIALLVATAASWPRLPVGAASAAIGVQDRG